MRLIDAEALREKLYEWCGNHCNNSDGCQYCKVSEIIDIVEDAPTIEAKPIVHAHWENKKYYIECSNCKEFALMDGMEEQHRSKYCPHCGAQMDEEVE